MAQGAGGERDLSFHMSFHHGPRHTTGRDQADRASDLSSKDSTRQYLVDGSLLSCKQQVGGSSPPASSQSRRSEAI